MQGMRSVLRGIPTSHRRCALLRG